MKTFEIFEGKKNLTEGKVFKAAMKLCESMIKEYEVDEARSDTLGRKFNKMFSWDKFSNSDDTGGGTPQEIMRIIRDLPDAELIRLAKKIKERPGSGSSREFQIKAVHRELKRRHGLTPRGNLKVATEAEGDIEWQPQPEFKGKAGITTDTGIGAKQRQMSALKKEQEKFNQNWNRLLRAKQQISDPQQEKRFTQQLAHLAQVAKKKGLKIPNEHVLGLSM